MQEDRQREIAAENHSLMHRLAGIMKEERGGPAQKYAHLSVEYRGSLRRKKLLKLEVCLCSREPAHFGLVRTCVVHFRFFESWNSELSIRERETQKLRQEMTELRARFTMHVESQRSIEDIKLKRSI